MLQTNTEAFLYCMGTIKFISGNPGFLNEMISKGAVEILMNLITQINENTKECGTCLPNSGHLLVQVSIFLEKMRCVKLVFMLPSNSYLPGERNRRQVGCSLRPGGCPPWGSRTAVTALCPPCVCPFSLERLVHAFHGAAVHTACTQIFHYPAEKEAWKHEKAAHLCKTIACYNQNYNDMELVYDDG